MPNKYDDIINLPHHVSTNRKRMSNYERAAQFSPFAALKGYDDEIEEAARVTEAQLDVDCERVAELNAALIQLKDAIKLCPLVKVTYFVKDDNKKGGAYVTVSARATKLAEYDRALTLDNKLTISFDDIYTLELVD